jgi:hypothetical protein
MKHTNKLVSLISAVLLVFTFSAETFAKNDKKGGNGLPPGLEKKADKGQSLPPGWQKKLAKGSILDASVFAHAKKIKPEKYEFSPDPDGMITVKVEGKIVRLMEATHEIIDILQ